MRSKKTQEGRDTLGEIERSKQERKNDNHSVKFTFLASPSTEYVDKEEGRQSGRGASGRGKERRGKGDRPMSKCPREE